MDAQTTFIQLAVALLLGLVVGLQRERVSEPLAGLRTFPLITILGALAALLDGRLQAGGWIVAAGLLGVVLVVGADNLAAARRPTGPPRSGITTEVAALVMYFVGGLLILAPLSLGVVVGGAAAVLLEFKPELHGFVAKLQDRDVRAIMQLVLISCIVLPVLPNEQFGPFAAFNPFETWLMVVLVSSISFAGYALAKLIRGSTNLLVAGLLGGLISSTATTASCARRNEHPRAAAVIVALASAVVYVRLLIELAAVAPSTLGQVGPPLAALWLTCAATSLLAWRQVRAAPTEPPVQKNPLELSTALLFAGIYALVHFALAAAQHFAGAGGLYAVAGLSGLTDLDAVTLSTARLMLRTTNGIAPAEGWRLIVVASISNLAFKGALAGLLGGREFARRVWLYFSVPILVSVALVLFWPDR